MGSRTRLIALPRARAHRRGADAGLVSGVRVDAKLTLAQQAQGRRPSVLVVLARQGDPPDAILPLTKSPAGARSTRRRTSGPGRTTTRTSSACSRRAGAAQSVRLTVPVQCASQLDPSSQRALAVPSAPPGDPKPSTLTAKVRQH